jgi:hypothetical protein
MDDNLVFQPKSSEINAVRSIASIKTKTQPGGKEPKSIIGPGGGRKKSPGKPFRNP